VGLKMMRDNAGRTVPRPLIVEMGGKNPAIVTNSADLDKASDERGFALAINRALRELLINRCRSFIFTTALPPAVMASALAAIDIVAREPERRDALWENCRRLADGLNEIGFPLASPQSPILPLVVGDAEKCMQLSGRLLENGIFAQGIRPPTVPAGTSRLRLTLMATHRPEHIERALAVFAEIKNSP